MGILKSFFLRIPIVLLSTITVCQLVMAGSLGLQSMVSQMHYSLILALLFGLLLGLNVYFLRRARLELSMEVARILYPTGAALSLMVSLLFMLWLDDMIPGEGREHYVMIFVGLGIAIFLLIRCFDIGWLRSEEEIQSNLKRNRN